MVNDKPLAVSSVLLPRTWPVLGDVTRIKARCQSGPAGQKLPSHGLGDPGAYPSTLLPEPRRGFCQRGASANAATPSLAAEGQC